MHINKFRHLLGESNLEAFQIAKQEILNNYRKLNLKVKSLF